MFKYKMFKIIFKPLALNIIYIYIFFLIVEGDR